MIVILSTQAYETTTEAVMDWIRGLGGDVVRVNGEDLAGDGPISMRFDNRSAEVSVRVGGRHLTRGDVRAVWLRRGFDFRSLKAAELVAEPALGYDVQRHLVGEMRVASQSLHALLDGARWLTRPGTEKVNKLHALRTAAAVGLDIPATLVTTSRAELKAFRDACGRIITKSLGEAGTFQKEGRFFGMYTAELGEEELERLPEFFFPSLAQEMLEKRYELRVFYLAGRCWPMAIFSQNDAQTTVDFRRYNLRRPNRYVPYRLPAALEDAIGRFMREMGLDTGSLDLVRTPDGRHVFLEVNPVGQFGMVSHPCNYHLEKQVAEHLMELEERDARAR
jgi:ATP-GRASP peptide maturase of grasp-with-spasm system